MSHHRDRGLDESFADLALLDMLTAPEPPAADALLAGVTPGPGPKKKHTGYKRRDEDLDPLLLAAAATYGGPHVTRNHYAHDFFPAIGDFRAEGAYDWTSWRPEDPSVRQERKQRLKYVSRQAPRSQRLREEGKENAGDPLRCACNLPHHASRSSPTSPSVNTARDGIPTAAASAPPLDVKCMARTRVPTPHGPVFLHLYHNNRDNKEHLAIVVDPIQLQDDAPVLAPPIRSRTLDAVWSESETEMERITRGAYVGRLSSTSQTPSQPHDASRDGQTAPPDTVPSPLIRIHSECFTGETIGSMRCDCGEQLDEAIRQIALPISVPDPIHPSRTITIPGRGAVVYLRQEGRGIGLLSKIRAYNLQDLGHDTVTANLMLGHKADERGYDIAGAILRDLGLDEGVRLLTNNPDKMAALESEAIRVVERVPMVPRSWQRRARGHPGVVSLDAEDDVADRELGATMIGSGEVYGEDLDKYLRTKVERMGHLLPLLSHPHAHAQ